MIGVTADAQADTMKAMGEARRERDVIFDSIADGVFTVDGEWRITSFNRAAERITGVPREEAIGRQCSDIFRSSICIESSWWDME